MPAGDRTGPMGRGPMSGRGLGYCAGYGVPGSMNTVPGWGWGFGRAKPDIRTWFNDLRVVLVITHGR